MSGSYSSRLRAGGGLGMTTVLAAKVAFASAALAAAASVVPQLVSGADAFQWRLYLFVTVHVIIFVIWKLSDNKHFHASAQQHKDPWAPAPLLTEEVMMSAVERKVEFAPTAVAAPAAEVYRVPPVSRRHDAALAVVKEVVTPGSCGGESCVTTKSEEDATSVERGLSQPLPPATAATAEHFDDAHDNNDGGDADDLDATWNAILQKTRPAAAPASSSSFPQAPCSSPPPPPPRAREPSVSAAELSKRCEDFIKEIHHSFVRQH